MTAATIVAPGTHTVQFYEREESIYGPVAAFLAEALRRGRPGVMLSRPATSEAVLEHLISRRDLTPGEAGTRILCLDVNAALAGFMDGETPDPTRFEASFASLEAALRGQHGDGPIWIYGEMVTELCARGNLRAAVQIEELWNVRFAGPQFAVLCGYAVSAVDVDRRPSRYHQICRQHTHVRLRASAAEIPTVYVIDDDLSVRRALACLLGAIDLPVQTFDSAEAFLDEVDPAARGCLLLDLQLGGMSGSSLQSRMARTGRTLPTVAMSGADDPQIEADAIRRGARAFLHKPFDGAALIEALAVALAH